MIVKKLRLQRGWSQEQLAQLSGLSVRTIQRIEKGQAPGLESLKSLAAVFEVSITDLKEETNMNTHEAFEAVTDKVSQDEWLAFEQVRKIKGFYAHLITYCVIVPALFIVNFLTSSDYIWAFWPMLGWGIGIISHGLKVFGLVKWLGPEWEKKQVEKFLGRKL